MVFLENLKSELEALRPIISELHDVYDIERSQERIAELHEKAAEPNFWDDMEKSQKVLQETRNLGIKQSLWSLLASLIVIVMMYLFLPYSLFILPFWPLSFICFVTCFNCYPVIRKHVIQPYYDQRGESNPEFAYKNADPDEQLFEDRAAEETPVKTKESRKKGKTIS